MVLEILWVLFEDICLFGINGSIQLLLFGDGDRNASGGQRANGESGFSKHMRFVYGHAVDPHDNFGILD